MRFYGIGRLTKDIDVKHSQNGTAYLMSSIACDRKYSKGGEKQTDFFNLKAFGKVADNMDLYLHKGSKIMVEGDIQNESWEKDGVKHTQTTLYVQSWEFAESKGDTAEQKDDFLNVGATIDVDLPF